MNRRTALATAGISLSTVLSGCIGAPVRGDGGSGDGSTKQTASDQYQATVEYESDDELPVQHEITVTHPEIGSPESPLTLEVQLHNETETTVVYGHSRHAIGLYLHDSGCRLITEDDSRYTFDRESERWVATETLLTTLDVQFARLGPSESHTQSLVVIAEHDEQPPTPAPETFEFESQFSAGELAESTASTIQSGSTITWRITLNN